MFLDTCDLTVVQVYTIRLNFGSDTCQIKVKIVQVNTKSAWKMSDVHVTVAITHYMYTVYPSSQWIPPYNIYMEESIVIVAKFVKQ